MTGFNALGLYAGAVMRNGREVLFQANLTTSYIVDIFFWVTSMNATLILLIP